MTLLCGHAVLAMAYLVALQQGAGFAGILGCLLLLGVFYAATDGVLMALASGLCSPEQRASGMALVTTAMSAARFVASIAFGALWTRFGADVAVYAFFGALVVAVAIAGSILGPHVSVDQTDDSSR